MAHFKTPFSIQCKCGKIYSKNTQFDAGFSGNYIRIICRSCDTPIIFEAFDDFSRYDVMVGGAIRLTDLNWYHRALMKLQQDDADDKAAEVSKNAAKGIADLQRAEESESSKKGDVEESAVEDEHDKQCKALVSSDQAAEVARTAAKSIADLQSAEESESSKEGDVEESAVEDEYDKHRKAAVYKLDKASEDTILRQLLKALDTSVENFASGARRGGSNLVHKLQDSAVNLAESIQQGGIPAPGSLAPSILESGKAFTAKGMQVLELVGKAKTYILITETGIQVQGNMKEGQAQDHEDQLFKEVTFDRCFYIYGGPEKLEELEALANHYTLLFNRRKAKLSSEQKSFYEGKLKQLQQIFSFSSEIDGSPTESEKGKKIDTGAEDGADNMKILHDSSVSKAAEMAAGFANALAGIAANDIIQKTAGRLDSLHSKGVHRLSEICCSAVSQLLMLAKSVISNAKKAQDEDVDEDMLHMDWPEDSIERAKIIRTRAQSMTGNVEAVCNSFITGIADVAEAYAAAIKGATADSQEVLPQKSIQEKADSLSKNLRSDQTTAVGKIQDGLQYLTYVVLSTSMHVA